MEIVEAGKSGQGCDAGAKGEENLSRGVSPDLELAELAPVGGGVELDTLVWSQLQIKSFQSFTLEAPSSVAAFAKRMVMTT